LLRGRFRAVLRSRARFGLPVACVGRHLRHLPAVSGDPSPPPCGSIEGPSRLLAVPPPVARSVSGVPRRAAAGEPPRAPAPAPLPPPPACGVAQLARPA